MPRWCRTAVVVAALVTVAGPAIGGHLLWVQTIRAVPLGNWWFQYGLAAGAGALVALALLPRFRMSRLMRLALLLPAIHVLAIAGGWALWRRYDAGYTAHMMTLALATPLARAALGIACVGALAALAIARRRRDAGWSHAFATFGLANLLAIGLWLPLTAKLAERVAAVPRGWYSHVVIPHPLRLAAFELGPALVLATLYTALAIRRPRRRRTAELMVLAVVMAAAVRFGTTIADSVVYGNTLPLVLAAALVACGGLVSLVIAGVWSARRHRTRLAPDAPGVVTGIIVADGGDDAVGVVEVVDWLRPPRRYTRSFVVATAAGELPVVGAHLIAPLPLRTTALAAGESYAVLRVGDRVALAGLARARRAAGVDGDPYRAHAGMVAGDDVAVARIPAPDDADVGTGATWREAFADVALAAWRPAVAYLVILVAVALPAFAGALASD